MKLSDDVEITLPGLRVVEHSVPLFLIGADVMRYNRSGLSYSGLKIEQQGSTA